jgi:hypothetical protein
LALLVPCRLNLDHVKRGTIAARATPPRIIDLSRAAAQTLGFTPSGEMKV